MMGCYIFVAVFAVTIPTCFFSPTPLDDLTINLNLDQPPKGYGYEEDVMDKSDRFTDPILGCVWNWAFNVMEGVSLARCKKICLEETKFHCHSIEYLRIEYHTETCYWLEETKESQPGAWQSPCGTPDAGYQLMVYLERIGNSDDYLEKVAAAKPQEHTIDWKFGMEPVELCVDVGDDVVFSWDTPGQLHNVIALDNEKAYRECEGMDSTRNKPKDRISFTMTSEGTFFYACGVTPPVAPKPHCLEGGMKAKIQVGNCSK